MKLRVRLKYYLQSLEAREELKPESERLAVPTVAELAAGAGVTPATIYNILGRNKHLNLDTLGRILGELDRRGFPTNIQDVIIQIKEEPQHA